MRIVLLLLALLLQPAPPTVPLSATFVTSTSAVVSWQQPPGVRATCLRIYHAGATWPAGICWENLAVGPMRVTLPGIYTMHPAYRPVEGDRMVLAFGLEDVGSATLGQTIIYTTYLPLTRHSAPPVQRAVYLPVIRG